MSTEPLSAEKISMLRQLYQANVPTGDIMMQVGVSKPTLYKYLRSGPGISRYDARPDHFVWHEAFDDLTDEAAYWVGILITDGSIVGNGRRVKLSLQIRDIPTLERFKAFVRTSAPVGIPSKGSATVRFSSPAMCWRLAELNVVPRKSLIAQAPDCLINNRHFWRGVIDGDGSVFPNPPPLTSPGLRLCGSSFANLLKQWASVCAERTGEDNKVRQRPGSPRVSDVILHGRSAMIMAKWLYDGCTPESPAMGRKLAAFHEMLTIHGHRNIVGRGKYIRKKKTRC